MKRIIFFIRKHSKKKSLLRKLAVFLCDKTGGHEPSLSDCGYAGGGMLDRWCKWCDGIFQSPVLENDIPDDFSNLMSIMKEPPPEIKEMA